jgi:hypothetical protein
MLALQDGHEEQLGEPQRGYCIPGLSFTARSLFAEIRKHISGFEVTVELDSNMDKFSRLWPDELSTTEAARDLGYSPQNDLAGIVATVLSAHAKRKESAKMTFEAIDTCGSGRINDYMLVKYMRKHSKPNTRAAPTHLEPHSLMPTRPLLLQTVLGFARFQMDAVSNPTCGSGAWPREVWLRQEAAGDGGADGGGGDEGDGRRQRRQGLACRFCGMVAPKHNRGVPRGVHRRERAPAA